MPAGIRDLIFLVESLPEGCRWAAAGIGRFQLPVNTAAMVMGGHVRVGLEDNIYFDCEKRELATNEQLVARLAGLADELGRGVATPEQAREIIGLERWRLQSGADAGDE
jgi:3-keto-5-aminohexanoate cleavage enzyme